MRVLVTGGGGFLGSALVERLLRDGHTVRIIARGDYPHLVAKGAELVRGDLINRQQALDAAKNVDAVFHTAAKAGGWGPAHEYEAANVTGTQHVIDACRANNVPHLINTSSPSVVHSVADIEGGTEALPYATHFTAHYPRTKALAEQLVCKTADASLATVSLRPHFIWGPGDRHLLPRLVSRAKAGRLRQVGSRDVKTDTCFIDNCVDAHVNAWEALRAKKPVSGKAYFVSDDAPIGVWTMANRMLAAANAPGVGRAIPAWLAYAVGATLEAAHGLVGSAKEPMITRFAASELSHAQWFDISAAKNELSYRARVSIDEGLERLAAWCRANPL